MKLDRRGFLMTSFACGSSFVLPACDGLLGPPPEKADGSFGLPFTREDPGPWLDKIEIHQPVVYASLVDATRVRLWTEVRDVSQDINHEMTAEHYIPQIVLTDEFNNVIENRGFRYDSEARVVATVELPPEVKAIYAYELCNLHGWWRAAYSVEGLLVAPVGDARRAFTAGQPGQYAQQVPSHAPLLGRRPNGYFSVEVGDRAQGALHQQQPNHYIQYILVYDQYDQLREATVLGPNSPEAVYDFPPVGGTDRLRVLVYCNNYNWWEAEFSLV